jgi:hypothetical protein
MKTEEYKFMQFVDKKIFMFNIKEVHFSKNPFNIEGCDFLIFPFCKNKSNFKGFYCYKRFTSIIDLTQNLDTIWQKMHNNSKRYIKQAEKEDIKIRINCEYDKFFQIYKDFLRKKGINSFFEVFGLGIIPRDMMEKNGTLFVADYNGEILGGNLFLEDDSVIENWVPASKRLDNEKERSKLVGCANRLILWEAIKYAKEKGMTEFDLGGLFPENEAEKNSIEKGINSFKLSFGGEVVPGYLYEKGYSKILKIAYYLHHLKNKNSPV